MVAIMQFQEPNNLTYKFFCYIYKQPLNIECQMYTSLSLMGEIKEILYNLLYSSFNEVLWNILYKEVTGIPMPFPVVWTTNGPNTFE